MCFLNFSIYVYSCTFKTSLIGALCDPYLIVKSFLEANSSDRDKTPVWGSIKTRSLSEFSGCDSLC